MIKKLMLHLVVVTIIVVSWYIYVAGFSSLATLGINLLVAIYLTTLSWVNVRDAIDDDTKKRVYSALSRDPCSWTRTYAYKINRGEKIWIRDVKKNS